MANEIIITRDIECLQQEFKNNYADKIIIIDDDFYKKHEEKLKSLMDAYPLVDIATAPLEDDIISITTYKDILGGFIND